MIKAKILSLKPSIIFFLIIVTTFLLIYSLGYEKANGFIKYFSYLFSSIVLVIVIMNIKRFINYLKLKINNNKLFKKIMKNTYKIKFIKRYSEDIRFKNLVNLCASSIINFSFIFIKFIDGVTNKSIWFISLAVYYFLLIIVKLFLLNNLRRYDKSKEYSVYRKVGLFLMIINISLVIMIIQMTSSKNMIKTNEYIVYITALYTFYLIISAIVNLVKYRKFNSPILSSIKAINLISASTSILMLQTTMIITFGDNKFEFMKLMNVLTGSVVSCITVGISLYMIINGRRKDI